MADMGRPSRNLRPRRSTLVPAVVLIALGAFFLIMNLRPELDLEAYLYRFWPLFLILIGVVLLIERMTLRGTGRVRGSGWVIWLIVFLVFFVALGNGPFRHRIRTDSRVDHSSNTVDLQGAKSVVATIEMGPGELRLDGGASHLLEADFDYTVVQGQPQVDYSASGGTGQLRITQHTGGGIHMGNEENTWDLKFSNDVPVAFDIRLPAGEAVVHLQGMQATRFDAQMGAGELNLDLTGDWKHDLSGTIHGGVGEATIHLPKSTGAIVHASGGIGSIDASGLHQNGDEYTNDAYGHTPVTIHLNVEGGVGQINLIGEQESTPN